jgi:acyl-ACP thioesterase
VSAAPAVDLLPLPSSGRRFTARRAVRLGDVDPAGELRLDAIATYLQDVAADDAVDAGVSNALGWLVRRSMIRVERAPIATEALQLTTCCTGHGRSWAERRTSIAGELGGSVEAVSLWVQIDVGTGRPARLGEEFFAVWGEAAGDRVVSSRLSLPSTPPDDATHEPWSFRHADLDQFAHVNNAAHLAVAEELVQRDRRSRAGLTLQVEYLAPADAGRELALVTADGSAWLRDGATTLTAIVLSE